MNANNENAPAPPPPPPDDFIYESPHWKNRHQEEADEEDLSQRRIETGEIVYNLDRLVLFPAESEWNSFGAFDFKALIFN